MASFSNTTFTRYGKEQPKIIFHKNHQKVLHRNSCYGKVYDRRSATKLIIFKATEFKTKTRPWKHFDHPIVTKDIWFSRTWFSQKVRKNCILRRFYKSYISYIRYILYNKSQIFKLLKNRTVLHSSSIEAFFREPRISKIKKLICCKQT